MALYYDLAQDFGINVLPNGDYEPRSYVSVTPTWCVAVVRMHRLVTWDRAAGKSVDKDISFAASEAGETLIITTDCISVTTTDSKESHVTNMTCTLMGQMNYLAEIMPGDWILCWMANDSLTIEKVIANIRAAEPCNQFDDGLKFVGQVASIRKSVNLEKTSGTLTVRYSVVSHGFTPFDAQIYFNPLLNIDREANIWMAQMFGGIANFLGFDPSVKATGQKFNSSVQGQTAIQKFVELLLGSGIPQVIFDPAAGSKAGKGTLQAGFGLTNNSTSDAAPSHAYALPSKVASLLGRGASSDSGVVAFYDILDTQVGLQKYTNASGAPGSEAIFTPDMPDTMRYAKSRVTNHPILGSFLLQIPSFSGQTVWNIINQYLNHGVNEMYNCLRVNPSGLVVPTLTVRQLPFSTPFMEAESSTIDRRPQVTQFLELPRWKVPPGIIYNFEVGRTNALRTNYVHMTAQAITSVLSPSELYFLNPPLHDDIDIARNGLRMESLEVAVNPSDASQLTGTPIWNVIRSDFTMGQQLTLTGNLVLQGIQSPICIGDNVDFGDGAVYHIEGVSHTCSVEAMGNKTFMTVLTLTHGVSINGEDAVTQKDPSLIYAGTSARGLTEYDPSKTYNGDDQASLGSRETASPTQTTSAGLDNYSPSAIPISTGGTGVA
jgi:hypothetical protein